MLKLLVIVALATVASAARLTREAPALGFPLSLDGRIVGGEPTTIEDVPYQVSVRAYGGHYCGGSIISKYFVLTAGHCSELYLSQYSINAGSTYKAKGGSRHSVAEIVRHEKYASNRYGIPSNDIALFRVNEPFEFDETRQPISLFEEGEESSVGAKAVVTGWGSLGGWSGSPSILQIVTVPIIDKKSCNESYTQFGGLPSGQICAGIPEGGKDACQGDSGGPLAINGRLAGVVSWGIGCALPNQPGAYTEVSVYRGWIKANSGI